MSNYKSIDPEKSGGKRKIRQGFTLAEIIISLGIVVMLILFSIYVVDPPRQLAKGRNFQRKANLNVILSAVGQNTADNKGSFSCSAGAIPTTTKRMAAGTSTSYYDIGNCLVATYLNNLAFDPATTSAHYTSVTNYDTGYTIAQNATTGRVTVAAPAAELGESISLTR